MKKQLLSLLLSLVMISLEAYSINYTSASAGPADWNTATSWIPNGIPGSLDNVTISAGHTITTPATVVYCLNLTVDGTISIPTGSSVNIYGNYALNGAESGLGNVNFTGNTITKSISGSGTSSPTITWQFRRNRNIASNVNVTKTKVTTIYTNIIVRNSGTISLSQVSIYSGAQWIQEANSSLTLNTHTTFFTGANLNIGTFDASATGNTVIVNYYSCDIPKTISGYYNLTLTYGGTKNLIQNLTINGNLTITATTNSQNILNINGYTLTLKGNFIKTAGGHLSSGATSTIVFQGSNPQTITTAGSNLVFSNLTIDNSNGVTLSSGICQLSDVLTINNGTFTKGGTSATSFTLLSTATKTARIAEIGNGGFSGNFTVQRYITARDTTWSCIASPVLSTTVQDWDNELFIYYSTSSNQATVQSYDESIADYTPVSSAATSVSPMQGFEVYLTASTSLTNISNITLNTIGVPNFGDQSMALSYTDGTGYEGQNLVGNPFASSIDWSTVYSASSNIDNYADVYDYTVGNYANVNLGDEIGTGQGFWVYALSAGATLNIPESAKTISSNSSLRSVSAPLFNLTLASADGSHSLAHKLELTSSTSFENSKDANDRPYRTSPNKKAPKITAVIDGKDYVRNAFSSNNNNYDLPLSVQVGIEGKYAINASNMDMVSNDYSCVTLEDKKLNQVIDLNNTTSYAFFASPNDSKDRFQLHFAKDGNCRTMGSTIASAIENQVQILPTINGNSIAFNFAETLNTTVTVTNLLGQSIVEGFAIQANTQTIELGIPSDFSGMYIIKIENEKGVVTKKFVKK